MIGRKQGSKRLQIGGQIFPPETNKSQVCLCIVNLQSTKDTSTVLTNDLTKKQGQHRTCYHLDGETGGIM